MYNGQATEEEPEYSFIATHRSKCKTSKYISVPTRRRSAARCAIGYNRLPTPDDYSRHRVILSAELRTQGDGLSTGYKQCGHRCNYTL
eukprot:5551966-Amphidinium_carterae.1